MKISIFDKGQIGGGLADLSCFWNSPGRNGPFRLPDVPD
jgi:hypothetical protein